MRASSHMPCAETDQYLVTRGFLSNPKRSLDVMMADQEPD